MNKIPLKVVTCFTGIGFQERGIEDSGLFDMEAVNTCEMDSDAIVSYAAIHNGLTKETVADYPIYPSREEMAQELTDMHIGYDFLKDKPYDWQKLAKSKDSKMRLQTVWLANKINNNVGDITRVNKFPYCDLLTFSFPCVTDDSLILTKDGYKEMKDVNVGDVVLTKSNTWHPIVKKFDNGVHDTCYIDAYGFENMHCTLNHKFYVREMYRTYPTYEDGRRGNVRHFKDPEFKEAKNLTRKDYFGIPVIKEEQSFYTDDLDFWYMIGYYMGDGYLSKTGYDIRLCCNDGKLEKLKNHLDVNKWNYHINDEDNSCHKLRFANKDIYEFISNYIGKGCNNKKIPYEILTLPKQQLEMFLKGYIDSDGNINSQDGDKDYIRITSVNRQLIYSTACIINKLYNRPVAIHKIKEREKPHYIDNREIKSNYPVYELKFKYETNKQDKAFYEDGYIWYPFYKLTMADKENVYNIEVEEDHSYVLQGCISKNCTDISIAGRQAGMVEGETRSGLVYEVLRILKNMKTEDNLPTYLLMENVDALVNKKNKPQYEALNEEFSELGYDCKYEVINGKNCGVPQNRSRVFAIYWLRDKIDLSAFEFPQPFDDGRRLKDILLDEVDEKYFITNERAQALIRDLVMNDKIQPTEEDVKKK